MCVCVSWLVGEGSQAGTTAQLAAPCFLVRRASCRPAQLHVRGSSSTDLATAQGGPKPHLPQRLPDERRRRARCAAGRRFKVVAGGQHLQAGGQGSSLGVRGARCCRAGVQTRTPCPLYRAFLSATKLRLRPGPTHLAIVLFHAVQHSLLVLPQLLGSQQLANAAGGGCCGCGHWRPAASRWQAPAGPSKAGQSAAALMLVIYNLDRAASAFAGGTWHHKNKQPQSASRLCPSQQRRRRHPQHSVHGTLCSSKPLQMRPGGAHPLEAAAWGLQEPPGGQQDIAL